MPGSPSARSINTLYKYVARHGWKKRYRVLPRGEAAARANRGRHVQPALDFGLELLPVKGAGGRFICREDRDRPVATGLKATDPAGAKRAATGCGGAAHVGALAQAAAEETRRLEQQVRAHENTNTALKNLREYREQRARKGVTAQGDHVEAMLVQIVDIALTQWEALLAAGNVRA